MTHSPNKVLRASQGSFSPSAIGAGLLAGHEGLRLGFIVGATPSEDGRDDGFLQVNFEGNLGEPLPARSLVSLTSEQLALAIRTRQGAALLFERGDPQRPVLIGLLQPVPNLTHVWAGDAHEGDAHEGDAHEGDAHEGDAPLQEAPVADASEMAGPEVGSEVGSEALGGVTDAEAVLPLASGALQVKVEESCIRLEAQSTLILSCGQASLTLQPDGRVIVRGTDILSHAKGTQRIRGAAIQLN